MGQAQSSNDAWANDKLNRQADGEHLIGVLLERYESRKASGVGSYILNIDASWGEGKTFFLKCLQNDLLGRGYTVASVNAWTDDLADDPLTTVMAAINDALRPFTTKSPKAASALATAKRALGVVALEGAKQVGVHALKAATGISVTSLANAWNEQTSASITSDQIEDTAENASDIADKVLRKAADSLIERRMTEHASAQAAVKLFRSNVSKALKSSKSMDLPLFVFIDELDRCRPLYAIKLLEELKHLFEIDGIVFIVATDSEQLAHSVRAIYGSGFEGRKYLRRFFDRVFVFPEPDRKDFINHLLLEYGIQPSAFYQTGEVSVTEHIESWMRGLGLNSRDLIQCFEIISSFVTSWQHNVKIEPVYLLGLVFAFYESRWVAFHDISKPVTANATLSDFVGWTAKVYSIDNEGRSVERTRTGEQLLKAVTKAADTDFRDVHNLPLFTNLLVEEVNNLHQGRLTVKTRSVLHEYPSRVRNAGRVLDRAT